MAPGKKAKIAAKPVAGGGLTKFFGGSKSGDPGAAGTAAPAPPLPAAKAELPIAAATPASQPASGGLTDAQKQRIDENRRKALERQQAKKNGPPPATDTAVSQQSPLPLKSPNSSEDPTLKRKGSDITPEKIALPEEKSRIAATGEAAAGPEDKFRTFGKVPWMQYNDLYAVRLQKLRGAVLSHAKSLWSSEVPSENFLPVIVGSSSGSKDVVVIGVTFKDMPSRDNVIEQYRDPNVATSCLPEDNVDAQQNLCSDADVMWLEDGARRIELKLPKEKIDKLATGFVAAFRGQLTADGKFEAKDVCLAQGFASSPLPASLPATATTGPYLALLSGLFIGAPNEDIKARQQAVDFLLGNAGVKHIIVAGGVYFADKLKDGVPGLADADRMFAQLAEKMPVDVMPGHKDPTNVSMPQMALHPYLFRSAQKSSQFKSVSNPYQCSLGDLNVLGHSGQPVRDLMRCTSIATPLEALTTCLDGQLIAPTAPDTLITQSFAKADPFVMEAMPQILFSAGHGKGEYEYRGPSSEGADGTLCVCVPAFHKHPSVVLVNMNNPRDIHIQEFEATAA